MTKLAKLEVDPTPGNVSAMMERGHFHSHQDGAWRYSPFGGETVHVNDPTELFDERAEFGGHTAAAVCRSAGIFAQVHRDNTRGLRRWEPRNQLMLWQMYGPRDAAEAAQRAWLERAFTD